MAHLSDTGQHSLDNSGVMRAMALEAAGLPGGPGPHWIDARLLAKAAAQRIAPRAEGQQVVVKLSVNSEEPAVVIGFAPMLLKALELLAANALAAMPSGGSVKFRVYKEPYVVIEVIDTGGTATTAPPADSVGLDNMTRSWRAPSAAPQPAEPSRKMESRLEAAKEIVQSHRGCLWQRPSGSGTSVIIELPSAGGGGGGQRAWRKS